MFASKSSVDELRRDVRADAEAIDYLVSKVEDLSMGLNMANKQLNALLRYLGAISRWVPPHTEHGHYEIIPQEGKHGAE